jgi:hypothetical protein
MLLPLTFPASSINILTLVEWVILIICSILMLFTLTLTVKLMQTGRVSVITSILAGVVMIASSVYVGFLDYLSCVLILLGIGLLIKKEYMDN